MNAVDHLKNLIFKFLNSNFAPEIIKQIASQRDSDELVTIKLSFDLSLIINQQPQLGYFIYNDYPSFLALFPSAILKVISQFDSSLKVRINQINPIATFIKVPKLESPLQDYVYQSSLRNKATGALLHLKRITVAKVFQRQEYLRHQFYQCTCREELFLHINELISLIKKNPLNIKNHQTKLKCSCQNILTEVVSKRRFEPCQRLLVHIHDLDPSNRKYHNILDNQEKKNQVSIKYKQYINENANVDYTLETDNRDPESAFYILCNNRYNLKNELYTLYLVGDLVNKFSAGMEIYSLAYFDFHIEKETREGQQMFIQVNPYFVAVTADQFTSILNKDYFLNYQQIFSLSNQSQVELFPIISCRIIHYYKNFKALQETIERSNSHFTYTKDNPRFAYDIFETLELISQNVAANTLPQKSFFPFKMACLLSIFLQNYHNFSYYMCRHLEKKQNLLVRNLSDESIEGAISDVTMHLCFILEDTELIIDAINEITCGLEDVHYLPPDMDETTFDLFLLNLVKGGILIVKSYYHLKDFVKKKLKQILRGNMITLKFKDEYLPLKLNCSIWFLVELMELTSKKKNDVLEIKSLSTNEKFSEIKLLFDIVLDLTSSNNLLRSIKNDFYIEQMEKVLSDITKQDLDQTHCDQQIQFKAGNIRQDLPKTAKKGVIEKEKKQSVSSCYIVSSNNKRDQLDLLNLFDTQVELNQRMNIFLKIDQECENILQKYYFILRKQVNQNSRLITSCLKIATASSLIRYYTYSAANDSSGFYSYLLLKTQKSQEKIPWNYGDIFLSILITLESRLNVLGSDGGVFGVEPGNLLYNSMNNLYKPIELSMIANTQEDIKYLKFKQLYEKILNQFS